MATITNKDGSVTLTLKRCEIDCLAALANLPGVWLEDKLPWLKDLPSNEDEVELVQSELITRMLDYWN